MNAITSSVSNIYKLDGRVPLPKAIPFGLQHVLAMFVSNLAPISIIAAAAGLAQPEIAVLVDCTRRTPDERGIELLPFCAQSAQQAGDVQLDGQAVGHRQLLGIICKMFAPLPILAVERMTILIHNIPSCFLHFSTLDNRAQIG